MSDREIHAALLSYIEILNKKFERGTISSEKYSRLATKVIAWEENAVRKGLIRVG